MGTVGDAMRDAGFEMSEEANFNLKKEKDAENFNLSKADSEKVKKSLKTLRKKLRRATCRDCEVDIQFLDINGKMIPHDIEGGVHWKSCPYSAYTQRKASVKIMKKLAILFIVKLGLELEKEAGLTIKEAKVVHAVLEKAFKETSIELGDKPGKIVDTNTEETIKEDLKVVDTVSPAKEEDTVHGDDPIGDPDEDLAPSEEAIQAEKSSVVLDTVPNKEKIVPKEE